MNAKLVTLAIPVYKRFQYVPSVLEIAASQDYRNIDLLVSDNGMNGTAVQKLVDAHYPRPYRFRQNATTVDMSTHFNQLIDDAAGEYFVELADDDEITPNYVSELVRLLEKHPDASVAMSIQETIDEAGRFLRSSRDTVPELLSGEDFIKAAWDTHEYAYESFSTFLARTSTLKACGGFPRFWKGTAHDDALMVKLALGGLVAFSTKCVYRKRYSEATDGFAMPIAELARGLKDFIFFLDHDPVILNYASSHSSWGESKRRLTNAIWRTYYYRWLDLYRGRLSPAEWTRAAFYLPFIPAYYRAVMQTFVSEITERSKQRLPWAYQLYRRIRPKSLAG